MKLNAKVIGIQAVSGAHDGKRRVDIKPEGSYGSIIVPSEDLQEDAELVLLVLTKEQAARIAKDVDALTQGEFSTASLRHMADQLRPDPPPPWEQPDESTLRQAMADTAGLDDVTQEFAREAGR